MKKLCILVLTIAVTSLFSCDNAKHDTTDEKTQTASSTEFYQLKTYTFDTDEQQKVTENYLKTAFLPAVKKLGIKNVGIFKFRNDESVSSKKILVFIPYPDLEQFQELEGNLAQDDVYLSAANEYINASHDNPPYKRIESTLLKAFDDMPLMQTPSLTGPRTERVYELRSYESATEAIHNMKVDMFNAGGEIKLFESLDFNAVFYAKVISGAKMPNLMYMISFEDQASKKAHWDAFVSSPEWAELKEIPKYKNTVSHIDSYLLYPTDYSDY